MKETLKMMKKTLIEQTQSQIANLECADYEELGAAIDMIKDLEEALYYCTIIEAMELSEEDKHMRWMPSHMVEPATTTAEPTQTKVQRNGTETAPNNQMLPIR